MLAQKQDYFGLQTQSKSLTPRGPNVGNFLVLVESLNYFFLCVIALFCILDVSSLSAVATLKAHFTCAFYLIFRFFLL